MNGSVEVVEMCQCVGKAKKVHQVSGVVGCELFSDRQAAKYMGVSKSHFRNMHRLGHCPSMVKFGRSTRWRKSELDDWMEAGLPPVHKWDWAKFRMRKMKKGGAK